MLKPLIGSLALVTLGASALGADEASPDISTWRWRVNAIINQKEAGPAAFMTADFDQRYERYSVTGMPEATKDRAAR